jgi:hypothetical protein
MLSDLARFGPKNLSSDELKKRLSLLSDLYYRALVPVLIEQPRNSEFWQRQKNELRDIGLQFSAPKLMKFALFKVAGSFLHPRGTIRKMIGLKRDAGRIKAQYYEG